MVASIRRAFVVAVAVSGVLTTSMTLAATSEAQIPAMLEVRASTGSMAQLGTDRLSNKIATIADYSSPGLEVALSDAELNGALEIHNVSSFDVVVTIHCSTQAARQVRLNSGTQALVATPDCTSVI